MDRSPSMTAHSGSALGLSLTLHALIAGVLLLFGYVAHRNAVEPMKVFELVAGEGDNYGAKFAPALGTPGGVKVDIPAPPAPKPEPAKIEPAKVESVKTAPVPAPSAPDFRKEIKRRIIREESKAKQHVAKERKAEEKRLAEEQKRMTKAEFDAKNKAKAEATSKSVQKIAKIDAEGIAKGVVGGSTANKVGGAGGKALVSDNDDLRDAYDALFKQRLKRAFEPPPGLSDSLLANVQVQSNADGSLTAARIVKSSGSAEFDRAVLDAIRRVQMPPRPDGRRETIRFDFTLRERDDG